MSAKRIKVNVNLTDHKLGSENIIHKSKEKSVCLILILTFLSWMCTFQKGLYCCWKPSVLITPIQLLLCYSDDFKVCVSIIVFHFYCHCCAHTQLTLKILFNSLFIWQIWRFICKYCMKDFVWRFVTVPLFVCILWATHFIEEFLFLVSHNSDICPHIWICALIFVLPYHRLCKKSRMSKYVVFMKL